MKDNIIISIVGPDGSGKTSIINKLMEKLSSKKIKYKCFHLKPELLKKNNPVSDPHNQIPRSKFLRFLKIIYWLILFRVYFSLRLFSKTKIYIFGILENGLFMRIQTLLVVKTFVHLLIKTYKFRS